MRAVTLAQKLRNLIARKHPSVKDFNLLELQEVIEQHHQENVELAKAAAQREINQKTGKVSTEKRNAAEAA